MRGPACWSSHRWPGRWEGYACKVCPACQAHAHVEQRLLQCVWMAQATLHSSSHREELGDTVGGVHLIAGLPSAVTVAWRMKGRYSRHPGGQAGLNRKASAPLPDEGPGYLGPVQAVSCGCWAAQAGLSFFLLLHWQTGGCSDRPVREGLSSSCMLCFT